MLIVISWVSLVLLSGVCLSKFQNCSHFSLKSIVYSLQSTAYPEPPKPTNQNRFGPRGDFGKRVKPGLRLLEVCAAKSKKTFLNRRLTAAVIVRPKYLGIAAAFEP